MLLHASIKMGRMEQWRLTSSISTKSLFCCRVNAVQRIMEYADFQQLNRHGSSPPPKAKKPRTRSRRGRGPRMAWPPSAVLEGGAHKRSAVGRIAPKGRTSRGPLPAGDCPTCENASFRPLPGGNSPPGNASSWPARERKTPKVFLRRFRAACERTKRGFETQPFLTNSTPKSLQRAWAVFQAPMAAGGRPPEKPVRWPVK